MKSTRLSQAPSWPVRSLVVLATTAALGACVLSTPAGAATTKDAGQRASSRTMVSRAKVLAAPNSGSSALKTYSASAWQQLKNTGGDPSVAQYWTAERMRRALPADRAGEATRVATLGRQLMAPARTVAPTRIVARPVTGRASAAAWGKKPASKALAPQPVTNFSPTNGKIFFRNTTNGKDYVCSGSALNSDSKRLVLTAGHCVYSETAWHANVVFVPGYNRKRRPYGTFSAYTMRTFSDWIENQNSDRGWNSDVALITTFDGNTGGRVVDRVGGHGLETGGPFGFDASIFGYPVNLSSGEAMWACWGTTGSRPYGPYVLHSMSGCNFGGGSSGGPWLSQYSNASGIGYAKSVTSNGPRGNASINGPYFDDRMWGLYNAANSDW